jgi:hypothetical protein
MQQGIIADPFAPLHPEPLNVAIPEGCTDVYHWVAYLMNGQRFAEYDAVEPAGSWHNVEIGRVTFIDLLPIRHACPDHEQLRSDCPRCQFSFRTRTLHPHRMRVPEGGRAYFERRRELINNEVFRVWTVVGWERHLISVKPVGKNVPKLVDLGERNVVVAHYTFFDDHGRSFGTSNLEEF